MQDPKRRCAAKRRILASPGPRITGQLTEVVSATRNSVPEDVTDRHLLLYNGIVEYILGLESELDDISSKKLNIIIAMVSKGMSDGRSADLSSVEHKGLQYIGQFQKSRISRCTSSITRSLSVCFTLGRKLDWLDEDPDSYHNRPTFFYENDVYNAAEKTNGLFRNHVVMRPILVIKRTPGMKAIFDGIIHGCGIYTVVITMLSGSGSLTGTLPSPWSTVQLIVWSTVNRSYDLKAGVPTILVLLGSIRKTKVILTACHMLVMLAFFENSYIMGSCLFVAALVWTLAQKAFC
ncbi:hypothetical protein EDB19DRAFT_1831660 [Suillus lakei]|nr:hypothetical protein EDB19DRAFT_1831660 [Suillus lakei]